MRRRELLTAIATVGVGTLTGCTLTSQNGTDNAAGTSASHTIEDDVLSIEGTAWHLCHSGITNTVVVDVYIIIDGETHDTIRRTVGTPQCGHQYEYSITYRVDDVEWGEILVEADVVERRK